MEQNLNSETHFNTVVDKKRHSSKSYGCANSLAELAGISTPDHVSESTPSNLHLLEHANERENGTNSAFANLLVGIRVCDEPRQIDAYNMLIRIARSVAVKSGYLFCSCSDDYKEIANNCLAQELQKHRHLAAFEIVGLSKAKRFAYIWKAFKCRFIDEMRKTKRRSGQLTDGYRQHSDGRSSELVEQLSAPCKYIHELETHWNRQLAAKQFLEAAKFLPVGQAAISTALAELFQNPEQLLELTDSNLSATARKTLFVDYVSKRRGVDAQIVRKDI